MKLKLILSSGFFIFSSLLFANSDSSQSMIDPETKRVMNLIYKSMSEVVPLSFEPDAFKSKENNAKILSTLKSLSEYGVELDALGKKNEKGFQFMSKTFAGDAQQIYKWYEEGDYEGARFYLHQVMDDCVQCHSKLPADTNFKSDSEMFKSVAIEKLPATEQARIYLATRQFDRALETYEKYFLTADATEGAYSKGAYLDYLKICIRVKSDFDRPIKLLESVLKQSNLPKYLNRVMQSWLTDLKNLKTKKTLNNVSLEEANRLINEGKRQMAFGTDRISLIHYTVASAILQKIVRDPKATDKQKSEAYFLLGVSESMLEHSFWVSESKHFYETAIRLAPKSPFAVKAYALLEEQVFLEYTGSKGINVPTELKKWLEELEKLVK